MTTRKLGILGTLVASLFLPPGAAAQSNEIKKEIDAYRKPSFLLTLDYEAPRQPDMYWQHPAYENYANPDSSSQNQQRKKGFWHKKSVSLAVGLFGSMIYDVESTFYCPEPMVCHERNVFLRKPREAGKPALYATLIAFDSGMVLLSSIMRKSEKSKIKKAWALPIAITTASHLGSGTYNLVSKTN